MRALGKILHYIDNVNAWAGRIMGFAVWLIMLIIVYDVILRRFHVSVIWAMELSIFIFTAMWLLGAGYTVLTKANVNMDMFYARLSPRGRAIVDVVTAPLFFIFIVMLVWKGSEVAWNATSVLQHTPTMWSPPVYIVKWLIPLGAFLMLLQGLANFVRNLITAIGKGGATL